MDLNTIFSSSDALSILRIMFLVGMVLYIIFAFVVVKQITHMTKTLRVGFESPIKLLGILHFMAAVGLFILGLFYL